MGCTVLVHPPPVPAGLSASRQALCPGGTNRLPGSRYLCQAPCLEPWLLRAHSYLWHGVKCSAGLAGHRAVTVRVPVCPWQPPAWAARLESCAEKAWSEAAVILQQGLGSEPIFAIVYQSPSGNRNGTLLPPSSTISFSTFPTISFGF